MISGGLVMWSYVSYLLMCHCKKMCLRDTITIYLNMDTAEKPPLQRLKTFSQ